MTWHGAQHCHNYIGHNYTGTELSIEKTQWPHTPPTREDVSKAKMLIVDLTMDYTTGIAELPAKAADLYTFMSAPPAGTGYPSLFGSLHGLRGKYFVYDEKTDHWYAVVSKHSFVGIVKSLP